MCSLYQEPDCSARGRMFLPRGCSREWTTGSSSSSPGPLKHLPPHLTDLPLHLTDLPLHLTDLPPHLTDLPPHLPDLPAHLTDHLLPGMFTPTGLDADCVYCDCSLHCSTLLCGPAATSVPSRAVRIPSLSAQHCLASAGVATLARLGLG